MLVFEATFAETLGIVDALDAGRVVLSHVEEMDCISYGGASAGRGAAAARGAQRDLRLGRHDGRRVTGRMEAMHRSLITIDLAAIRHNVRTLRGLLAGAELWAVVKADGYGHGATDVGASPSRRVRPRSASRQWRRRSSCDRALPEARIVVLGDTGSADLAAVRGARLELGVSTADVPEGVPVHLKLDTGMGRWGLSEIAAPGSGVVGVMSHFASADTDPAFTAVQLARFLEATAPYAHLQRHIANSAGTLRHPEAHLDAVRCGIALYGISPFGTDAAVDGLRPALRWESSVALVKTLGPAERTGYGRRFVALAADPDRDRPGRLRGRVPPEHVRHRGRRRGSTGRRDRNRLDGCDRDRAPGCRGSR